MTTVRRFALTIAGSDSCGGAGIQADLKTFAALGVHGLCAITAVTAQNLAGVTRVDLLPPEAVIAQMDAVLTAFPITAIKIGMLGSPALVQAVTERLTPLAASIPIVVDPVMVATSGARLLDPEAHSAMVELLALAALATPNPEEHQALMTGVHTFPCTDWLQKSVPAPEGLCDVLHLQGRSFRFAHPRRAGGPFHGTGCTLASAIAAHLARGASMQRAVEHGIQHVQEQLAGAIDLGAGQRLLPHGPLL